MPEGFETRQVIDSKSPSGLANRPVRQLGMVGVQAPRGGNMSQVGASQRAMAEALKMGGKALDGFLEKKKAKDEVTAEMLHAQGKTEADLEKEGYSQAVLKSYKTVKMKTAYNKWYTKMSHDAVNEYADMDPEQFRKEVLNPQFDELMGGLDPNDKRSRELYTTMGKQGFAKLVENHTIANTQFLDKESASTVSNLLYSEAGTGEVEGVREILGNFDALTEGMSENTKRTVMLDAMIPQLKEGNFLIYDEMGGTKGLIKQNYSPAQIESVKNAVKAAQSIRESEVNAERDSAIRDIQLRSKEGRIGPTQALEELEAIKNQYRISDNMVRSVYNSVNKDTFARELDDRQAAILHDPDFVQTLSQFNILVTMQGNSKQANAALKKISKDFDLPVNIIRNLEATVRNAQTQKENRELTVLKKEMQKRQQLQLKEQEASAALSAGTIHNLDKKGQALAMKMKMQEIFTVTEDPKERIDMHVEFLRSTTVIDPTVQQMFTAAATASPMKDGLVDEDVVQTLDYLTTMRQAGVSEATIRAYTGDAYDYLSTAAFLQNGSLDPANALVSAWEITRTPTKDRQTPRAKLDEVRSVVKDQMNDLFNDIEPSLRASFTNSASDADHDDVLTYEVEQAAKGSGDMIDWAVRRAETYAEIYPDMRTDAIMDKVKRDLSRWEYVAGEMVPPMGDQSYSEMLGMADVPYALASNAATMSYINNHLDEILPPGSDARGAWEEFKDGFGEKLGDILLTPDKFVFEMFNEERADPRFFDTVTPLNLFEGRQRRINNMIPMSVTPYSNGVVLVTLYADKDKEIPLGTPIALPAKEIGSEYKALLKDKPFN